MLRRTKIVATIGPASDTPETLRAMLVAGVDVLRFNFSHASDLFVQTAHRQVLLVNQTGKVSLREGSRIFASIDIIKSRWDVSR